MASNVTYAVSATEINAYMPQISIGGASDAITSAQLTTLIGHSAARLNGILISSGLDPTSINADTGSVAYLNAQQITIGLVLRHLMSGLTIGSQATIATELAAWAEAMISALIDKPDLLGAEDTSLSPEVKTTCQLLNLDMSTQAAENNRRWAWSHDSDDGKKTFHF